MYVYLARELSHGGIYSHIQTIMSLSYQNFNNVTFDLKIGTLGI